MYFPVLHPHLRIEWFKKPENNFDPRVVERAEELLQELYDTYAAEIKNDACGATSSATANSARSTSTIASTLSSTTGSSASRLLALKARAGVGASKFTSAIRPTSAIPSSARENEVDSYRRPGSFPWDGAEDDAPLLFWKVSFGLRLCLPLLTTQLAKQLQAYQLSMAAIARGARDVLAVPGVSVSVERLFSSCKLTLTDTRSALTAINAARLIVAKEWARRGRADAVAFLDGVSIHNRV